MVMNKGLFLSGIFFALLILFTGSVFSFECFVSDTCPSTPNPGENVLMKLSSFANAHGELRDSTSSPPYNYKVCCDFDGTADCDGGNKILSLSSDTNAHAEVDGTNGYNDNVCFGDVQCIYGTEDDCTSGGYDLEIVSLVDTTNSHLAEFDTANYGTKVCCKWNVDVSKVYFADAASGIKKTYAAVGDTIKLIFESSGLSTGSYDGVEIFEHDTIADDNIRTGADALTGSVDVNRKLSVLWSIRSGDYSAGGSEGDSQYYFIANGVQSSDYLTIIERDDTAYFCSDFTDEVTCNSCSNQDDCAVAGDSGDSISQDIFEVDCGETLSYDSNYKSICYCEWGESSCDVNVGYVPIGGEGSASHCDNGVKDADEMGTDCGGTDCGKCVTDSDGDGLDDDYEDLIGTDKTKADTDGDGFSDGEEVAKGTDPLSASSHPQATADDSDGDGLADSDENCAIDTDGDGKNNCQDADSDNDGFSDGEEIARGTNPLDANSHPEAGQTSVAHCKNNQKDEDEEGIDCGGDDCGICFEITNFPSVGFCNYISQNDDDCSDGYLEYSWIGEWSWAEDNNFSTWDNDFSGDFSDYVQGDDGLWHYDPVGMSINCNSGKTTFPCPAQVQLPFFGFYGIIMSLVMISLIYLYSIFKREFKIK